MPLRSRRGAALTRRCASVVLQLRVLGVGQAIAPVRLRALYSFVWPALAVKLASGGLLLPYLGTGN